jgi:hypothetical protein
MILFSYFEVIEMFITRNVWATKIISVSSQANAEIDSNNKDKIEEDPVNESKISGYSY